MLTRLLGSIFFIVIPFMVFAQVDLNKGLMAYYPFNGNANDVSGNGNNPIFNNATLTSDYYGKPNSAYHFNGIDNYIEIPNSNSLNTGSAISICAWVKPTGFYSGPCYNNMMVAKQTDDYVAGDYALRYSDVVNGCSANADSNKETFYGSDGGPGNLQSYIKRNKWYNVVFTSDGIRAKLYVNCKLAVDQPASLTSFGNAYNLFLGHMDNAVYPYWLNGDLDEVRIYNRVLNADEVEAYSGVCATTQAKVTASFKSPDTVCVNKSIQFNNTSQNASNYYWNFCAASFNTTPIGTNLGNPNNTLNAPVFMDYILDDNGNYYGFISNYNYGHLIRLNYGNSLLNNPVAEDLGNLGAIPPYAEGIQVKKLNGKCYVFIVSGGDQFGSSSVFIKADFGNSFANTPTATNFGNIGGLYFPHDLFITQDGNNFYGFTININDNSITRFDFGNNLGNAPTGVNLGSTSNLSYPCGFSFINSNGSWYAFITNRDNNTISRLDFGNSLINTPSGVNIGDPGNFLNKPRDISLFETCSGIIGLVVNEEDEQTGTITKLNFNSNLLSTPSAVSLGNIGNLKFPHSISKLFLSGNDIYSFITNVSNNTITKLRYAGCNNASIPSSTLQTPPAVSYNQPGVYNINLLVDIGLPTETSFCKQIIVKKCDSCTLKVNAGKDVSICYKDSTQLKASGAAFYNWNSSTALNDTIIANPVAKPLTTTQFIVTGYDSTKACSDKDTIKVSVLPLPVFTLTDDTTICKGTVVQLKANGNYHYHWSPQNYLSDTSVDNPISNPLDSIKYYVTATDSAVCRLTDSVQINVVPKPTVSTISDTGICFKTSILLSTNASNANTYNWNPASGLSNTSVLSPQASPASSTVYTVSVSNGVCTNKDSVFITVYPLPGVFAGADTTTCGNGAAQLHASGAINYQWAPITGISNPNISNPVALPASTTTYSVSGTDKNGCINIDSVMVSVLPSPQFKISPQIAAVCLNDSVILSVTGGNVFNWSPSQTVASPLSASTKVYPVVKTIYKVVVSDTVCKVTDTLSATININFLPVISIIKSNDIDCLTPQAQLKASGALIYTWSPSDYINNTHIADPVVSPLQDTRYMVTGIGSNSCRSEDSVLVKSSIGSITGNFYVPNAFTPNGDGLNDCFGVKYWGPADFFDMSIYNRWGQEVYHSRNIGECWNGTIHGTPQAAGTYVYQISVSSVCSQGKKVYKKGTIVLVR